jgi:hypothetical protein
MCGDHNWNLANQKPEAGRFWIWSQDGPYSETLYQEKKGEMNTFPNKQKRMFLLIVLPYKKCQVESD